MRRSALTSGETTVGTGGPPPRPGCASAEWSGAISARTARTGRADRRSVTGGLLDSAEDQCAYSRDIICDILRGMHRHVFALLACLAAASFPILAQWPQFRGPDGNGLSKTAKPPLSWGEDKNVRWKTPVHGRAWSS